MISIIFIWWHLWWSHLFRNFAIFIDINLVQYCVLFICVAPLYMFVWHLWLYNGNEFYAHIVQRYKCTFPYYLESQFSVFFFFFLCIIIQRVVYWHLHLNDHVLSMMFFFVSLFGDLSDTFLFYFISIKSLVHYLGIS